MYQGSKQASSGTFTRAIAKPGTPEWAVALTAPTRPHKKHAKWLASGLAGFLGALAPAAYLWSQGTAASIVAGLAVAAAPVVAYGAIARRYYESIVTFPAPSLRGVRIRGEGAALLDDIAVRFEYAERLVDEVPTGIDWDEVDEDAKAILWDATEHAARVSALDAELADLHYAEAGTPQAALKRQLEERRGEHLQVLLAHQLEADSLARAAGNALAAAKVALARTGNLAALEVVAPARRAMVARGVLAEARARLAMLADVWAELDESTDLVAEKYRITGATGAPPAAGGSLAAGGSAAVEESGPERER
ncbi:MAG TPA: hypothetical protein VF230_14780 [Acidimicrobiales bacterium]